MTESAVNPVLSLAPRAIKFRPWSHSAVRSHSLRIEAIVADGRVNFHRAAQKPLMPLLPSCNAQCVRDFGPTTNPLFLFPLPTPDFGERKTP
jgi:hypothetical protein